MSLPLSGAGDLLMKDTEKAETLNAFFIVVFTRTV